MAYHLIKRKDIDFVIKDGWYCEVRLNKWPTGIKVKTGDTIYVAQNGYAIFGKGIVDNVCTYEFDTFEKFVIHALQKSNIKDDLYWISKLREYSKRNSTTVIKCLEYNLVNTECFQFTIPLENKFLKQPVWYYLEDALQPNTSPNNVVTTLHIPTNTREEVYHKYKIVSKEHIIDVDHFVPKSVGGPGNIIENLIPISASINRRKSNHIPSKLFDFAEQFGFPKPDKFILSHDKFYFDSSSLKLAKKIVQEINLQDIKSIRETYKLIRDYHFPYLKNMR